MPRKKISEGGSPNRLHNWEIMATMSFTQFVMRQSGLSASELEEQFSLGRYSESKNPKKTGRQWMSYVRGKSAMSIKELDRCCNKAEDFGWLPHYLVRYLASLDAYLEFWSAQQKLQDALTEFQTATKALSCLAFISDRRQMPSDMPNFAFTAEALTKPKQMTGDAQPTYKFEAVVQGFSADVQSLYLDPIDPTGVFKGLSLPLLSILHSPSIMRPVDPVSAQPSIALQTS
jgi:hypothetical protein